MIYYIKEGQRSIFSKIKILENECEIAQTTTNTKKIERIIKKIKKKEINKIVLSKRLKENQEFINLLRNYDITILDGKWLMQYLLQEIIEYLNEKQKLRNIDEITILANDLSYEIKHNIIKFASKYKKLRIVTNHLEKFKKLEEELYDKKGISIIVTNNKRKALVKSFFIINYDFVQETINQYNINENAIIINLNDKIKINKKRFNGLIITDYEVDLRNAIQEINLELLDFEDISNKKEEFLLKEIIEEKIYSLATKHPNYNIFRVVENIIKKYNIKIKKMYGVNGVIS